MTNNTKDPEHIAETLKEVSKSIKKPAKKTKKETLKTSNTLERIIKASTEIRTDEASKEDIAFQHAILCQTCLPYRDPKDLDLWEKSQGHASLAVQTNKVKNPKTGEWERIGLPFGPTARLILAYINTQAIKTKSPNVEVGESMTAFVRRIGLGGSGRQIRQVKNQLQRLSASTITMVYADDDRYLARNANIIEEIDLWFAKDPNQRVLWESNIGLNNTYFQSLVKHAVPVDERALAALSNNAMALDVYCWLSQRLHRVNDKQFIAWSLLWAQFGGGYSRIRKFKEVFRHTLKLVLAVYPQAKVIEDENKGLVLHKSPPPIHKKMYIIGGSK